MAMDLAAEAERKASWDDATGSPKRLSLSFSTSSSSYSMWSWSEIMKLRASFLTGLGDLNSVKVRLRCCWSPCEFYIVICGSAVVESMPESYFYNL
ncbi:hypothetical protein C1H46_009201 [Malus baccata]|uniref:Uncharacterized protein n=1 Tax=Malus baccata TaxID=106549 RepID=A0A540N2G0_MALBA|nr:hypothetical protein C1H46_009201 [Malus baccata]